MEKNILFMVIIVAMLSLFITSCSSNEEGTIIELNQSSDDIDNGIKLIESLDGVEAYIIYFKDDMAHYIESSGFKDYKK